MAESQRKRWMDQLMSLFSAAEILRGCGEALDIQIAPIISFLS
jgi:hypothetical protein